MASPLYADTRNKILTAAAELLKEKSFFEMTLADVAAKAGVSKGTLYYYYNNKNDILFDTADRYLDSLSDDLLSWVDNAEKDTSMPRLVRYVLSCGVFNESGNLRIYLISEAVSADGGIRDKLLQKYGYFKSILAQRIAARRPGADGDYLAWLLLTVMDGLIIQNQLRGDMDVAGFIERTASLFEKDAQKNLY
ncbi:MAG: TetR/AcrR family transcriptional regulator [Oscillospiraceae bacterium]|nr:TetR/AcrR family transcriptional regulator [Oscillospiraceae bacterium]